MQKYDVTGMSCAACSARVEKVVRNVDGVTDVSVNLLTNSMNVEGHADSGAIIAAVIEAGYGASLKEDRQGGQAQAKSGASEADQLASTQKKAFRTLRNRLIASLCFLLPLMYVSMGHMMWGWPLPSFMAGNHVAMGLYQLLLTVAVMVINQKFFISGFTSAWHKSPNMDTLVAMGAGASFGYSVYALFAMTGAQMAGDMDGVMKYLDSFYFESAAMILTLITVGKMLEAYSKGRTTDALRGLMELAPKQATILVDGAEKKVPIDQVKVDDVLDHHMHSEFFQISEEAAELINTTRKNGGRIISVGTTSTRTLESAAEADGTLHAKSGWTDIFIYPGYQFKVIDGLITNFHLPESTLVMLVSALAGRKHVMAAYEEAVKERYRFFSFGDAMLII